MGGDRGGGYGAERSERAGCGALRPATPLLRERMSGGEVSGEWRQAGVTLVFEKVGLTSIPGSATEWLVQGWITDEPEEGGVTSAGQHGFVVSA